MVDVGFFVLGLVNDEMLILIFALRKNRMDLIKRFNWIYLLLAIPTAAGFVWTTFIEFSLRHAIFLGIFLGFLILEWLFDFVFKIDFRSGFKTHWKIIVPYLCFYYASNYGFAVMPWRVHLAWGIIMASLFVIQIVINLWSHPKAK